MGRNVLIVSKKGRLLFYSFQPNSNTIFTVDSVRISLRNAPECHLLFYFYIAILVRGIFSADTENTTLSLYSAKCEQKNHTTVVN